MHPDRILRNLYCTTLVQNNFPTIGFWQHLTGILIPMGLPGARKGFGNHEFTLLTTASSYAAGPPRLLTASARMGDLDPQPEYAI